MFDGRIYIYLLVLYLMGYEQACPCLYTSMFMTDFDSFDNIFTDEI